MGLLGKSDPYGGMSSLLGIDPSAMRRQALFNGLAAAGFTLMGDRNPGNAGLAFVAGTDRARDDYMRTALDAYRLKQADEDRQYGRQRDAKEDERWNMQWDYNTGRQKRDDARANTQFQWQMDEQQRAEDMRQGQQDAVTGWMGQQEQAGANLLPQNIRTMARQGGVEGMVPRLDEQRYDRMQPYVQAQDYGSAFQQMTAEPAAPEEYTLGEGQVRYRGNQPIAAGPQKQTSPTDDMREYSMAVQQGYKGSFQEYMLEMRKAGASTVTIGGEGDFDKKLMGGVADVYTKQFEQGYVAAQTKQATQQLRGLMAGQGGALDGLAAAAAPYLPEGMVPEGTNDLVAAQAIISGLIPKQRVPGSGTTSDYDARMFAQSLPSIWNQPGANEIIIDTVEAYADYQIAVSNIIAEVAADPSIKNKSGAIRDAVKTLPDPFAEWKQAVGSGGGQMKTDLPRVRKYNPQTGKIE